MIETKLTGESKDIVSENIEILKELFPDIVVEDKIDFDKFKSNFGEFINLEDNKYSFNWPNKNDAIKESQKQSLGTLRPCITESKNWNNTNNLYIEGDNLEVLKLLQKGYYNKVDVIYIDPPYNTGKDFIYKDNYKNNLNSYLKESGQAIDSKDSTHTHHLIKLTNNPESYGHFHSDWLNMMYPRLKLARNLLSENGVIFISIDDNEHSNLKKLCDEIFGEENFICNFIWRKKTGASDSKDISTITEYILTYVKSKHDLENIFTKNKESYDPKRYKFEDEYVERRGPYYPDNLDRGGIRYSDSLNYPIECPDGSITYPNGRTHFENDGWIWTWGKEKFEWGLKNGFIEFKKSNKKESGWGVYYKNYVNVNNKDEITERSAPHKNIIMDIINTEGSAEIKKLFNSKIFSYPKPSNLIKQLLNYVNNCNIVLDFFSGSGTTADAIMKYNLENNSNCKYILVQIPESIDEKSAAFKEGYYNLCEIGKERIRRAGDKIVEETGNNDLDIGFKVFKLDSSNLEKWDPDYNNIQQSLTIENIKKDRNNEDLVYEIMIKYGIDLTSPIEKHENIYSVGFGALIICLENNITKEITDDILKIAKNSSLSRVVFKDSGFASDAEKTNIKEILKVNNISEFITI